MRSVLRLLVGLVLAAGLAAGAWWLFGRGSSAPPDDTPLEPPAVASPEAPAQVVPGPVAPPVPYTPVEWEAIEREGEVLPEQSRPPMTVFAIPKRIAEGNEGFVRGDDLVDAMVAGQVVPIRFDSERTREQFRKARLPMPPPTMTIQGGPGLMLMQVTMVLRRSEQFSATLDKRALWIRAK